MSDSRYVWKQRRRAGGRCVNCATGVVATNRKTGEPFSHCLTCRVVQSAQDAARYAARKAQARRAA